MIIHYSTIDLSKREIPEKLISAA